MCNAILNFYIAYVKLSPWRAFLYENERRGAIAHLR